MKRELCAWVLLTALALGSAATAQEAATREATQSERVKVEVTPVVEARLGEIGFAVSPSLWHMKLAQQYRYWRFRHYPVIVTTDAALHTAHLYFDWYQRFLEIAHLRGDLVALTDSLIAKMMQYHDEAQDRQVRRSALTGASYLLVGKRLLVGGDTTGGPQPWKGRIEAELKLILEAEGGAVSPLFGYLEDYSQYKPRGHYARSPAFASYFRAMMWFGRMTFRLKSEDPQRAAAQTRAAVLLCRAFQSSSAKGEAALAVWRRIYETTAFFAGRSDDLLPTDYIALLDKSACDPADVDSMEQFMAQARALRKPRILGTAEPSPLTTDAPDWHEVTQGMRLFGQRYAMDADVMQRLTFDSVGEYTGEPMAGALPFTCVRTGDVWIRALPRGLDVMAAFGFAQAEEALHASGDDLYAGYDAQLARLRHEIAGVPESAWQGDLYALRLRWAAELIRRSEGALPRAMRTHEWSLKQLATALGSWTELKHDAILYTKQPYAAMQMALAGATKGGPAPPPPPPPRGYVEPVPHVYAAVGAGVEALLERIETLDYPEDTALTGGLRTFAGHLRTLEAIAKKELAGGALTDAEFRFIEHIGQAFRVPELGFPHHRDVTEPFRTEMDDLMPIVADVFTDPNSKMVLEQAIGRPMALYMVCPVDGEPTVCVGAVYSYYEFKRPLAHRLTDDEWRKMLKERQAPALPKWTDEYIVR